MNKKILSVVIPVFNERKTIEEIVNRVKSVSLDGIEKEILVIDDGSSDGSSDVIEKIPGIKSFINKNNKGKGSAIKLGLQNATGDILVIQDGDLEYDPNEYGKLIAPIIKGQAKVVYGSRFMSGREHIVLRFHHYCANRFLTLLSNLCSGIFLTDMETCYKVFDKEVYKSLANKLIGQRFGIEPEITARVAKMHVPIYEVSISYHSRGYVEGKKIKWTDGIAAIWHIIHFNFFTK